MQCLIWVNKWLRQHPQMLISQWEQKQLAASGGPEPSNWAVSFLGSEDSSTLLLESHVGPSKTLSEDTICILPFKSTLDNCTQDNATKSKTALHPVHNIGGCETIKATKSFMGQWWLGGQSLLCKPHHLGSIYSRQHGGRRELISEHCPLTSTCVLW